MTDDAPEPGKDARKLRAKGLLDEKLGEMTGNEERAARGRTEQTVAGVRDYVSEMAEREEKRTEENKE